MTHQHCASNMSLQMQVLMTERSAFCLSAMPYLPRLRHLIWGDYSIAQLCPLLSGFYALQTLVLGGIQSRDNLVLDLARLRALEHLHIINFAPQSIAACEGCKLHVSWDEEASVAHKQYPTFTEWLQSSLWASLEMPLGSLKLTYRDYMSEREMRALEKILNQDTHVDFVSLAVRDFGSELDPIQISKKHWQRMLTTKVLNITTDTTCNLRLENDWPSWTHLRINSRGSIQLEAESMQGVPKALQHCSIRGDSFRCTFMEVLCAGNCSTGSLQASAIGQQTIGGSGRKKSTGPYSLSATAGSAKAGFMDSLMVCGCHACLPCLRRDGVVSEDIRIQYDPNHKFFSRSFCAGTASSSGYARINWRGHAQGREQFITQRWMVEQ